MSKIEIKNIYKEVSSGNKDNAVGISLAHLAGNNEFSLFCTEIAPNSRVGAHYHSNGTEFYQILEGEGYIYYGAPNLTKSVNWEEPRKVKKGDFFMVEEGQVHQLHNTAEENLVVIFGCPKTHITTDRTMVNSFDSTPESN